jgi:hypothetical protein
MDLIRIYDVLKPTREWGLVHEARFERDCTDMSITVAPCGRPERSQLVSLPPRTHFLCALVFVLFASLGMEVEIVALHPCNQLFVLHTLSPNEHATAHPPAQRHLLSRDVLKPSCL